MGKIKIVEFEDCLKKNKIVVFPQAKSLSVKEMKIARDDLKTARESLKQKRIKWATIQSYYAMFHGSRALLYHKGYREKSHHCLIQAMKALYVGEGHLDVQYVEALQMGKILRENADYSNEFSTETAEALFEKAEGFLKRVGEILKKNTV